jgi:hypothetical protein
MVSVSTAFAQAAATACSAGAATLIPGATDNTLYIRSGFKPVCSANSVVRYTDSVAAQKLTAGAASVKGASYFGGSTLGGAIQRAGACALNTCGGTEAQTKADVGMTDADAYGASS